MNEAQKAATTGEGAAAQKATFAGGCFWCMQPPYEEEQGVKRITVGYTGGHVEHPTYEQVCSGRTGHTEAVEIEFDPASTSYERLLEIFWRNIDPTLADGQFADRGTQYRTGIFFHSPEQERAARESRARMEASGKFEGPIVTEITPASVFYAAEDYHQGYARRNPGHYSRYKEGSGRGPYLRRMWGK